MKVYELETTHRVLRYRDNAAGAVLDLPEDDSVVLIEPPQVVAAASSAVEDALLAPVAAPSLTELARGRRRVAIITSDSTRSVPCSRLLDSVVPQLLAAGVALQEIVVVVAVGAHRPATDEEMTGFLGSQWQGQIRIINHNAFDEDELVTVGLTPRGNEVVINRTVAEADLRIAFGQVEPHEFAGFSGGPKSVLAGVSGEVPIKRNHSPGMLMQPHALPGITAGNPIWEDMMDAATLLGLHFIVNVVLTPRLEIAGVRAGSLTETHAAVVDLYKRLYGVALPEPHSADIVVTTPGAPLDMNLYQCVKALVAVQGLVRDGGAIVLYAGCQEGTGGAEFVAPFLDADRPETVLSKLNDPAYYKIEMDHALLMCRLMTQRGLTLVLHTPGVPDAVLRSMFCAPTTSLQEAYGTARDQVSTSRSVVTLLYPQPQKVFMQHHPSAPKLFTRTG